MSGLELTLAAALLAPAQTGTSTITITDGGTLTLVGGASQRRPVEEQIEVMRALLLRKFGRDRTAQSYSWTPSTDTSELTLYGVNKAATVAQPVQQGPYQVSGYFHPGVTGGAAVEGTYLSGYGAVFTATLDAMARDPRPKTDDGDKPAPALTEWERTQRALRGESLPQKAATASKEPPLGDVLLKLLAENGKHFTALKDDERLTVSVTFRGAAATQTAPVRTALAGTLTAATPLGAVYTAREDKVGSLELLGEMHLKQGESQKAVDAYLKAVQAAEAEAKESADGGDRVQGALMKLAQALLAAGKIDEARETMDRAKTAKEKAVTSSKPAAKSAAPLPARLTVSAPKKLLDQVGAGKLSFDEFRKQATVEYVPAGK